MKNFLKKSRRGAMALVTLAGLVPVTAMMTSNINTSQMIDDRRQMQDASDALAMMHGTWSARALNIISMNNVTTAQLMTVAVGSEALLMTISELQLGSIAATAAVKGNSAIHCTPRNKLDVISWSPFCFGWHELINVPAYLAFVRAADIDSDFDPKHGLETARKALNALDGMNKALAARHPRAMAEIAQDYYGLLELDDHHFADPCIGPAVANCNRRGSNDGMALPIEAAPLEAYGKLALLMRTGALVSDTTFVERGFRRGTGPIAVGGSRRYRELKHHINDITEIGNALYEFRRFYTLKISDMPCHYKSKCSRSFFQFDGFATPPYRGAGFRDRRTDFYDMAVPLGERLEPIARRILTALRRIEFLTYNRHLRRGYLVSSTQSRRGNNSFFNNYMAAYLSVGFAPKLRARLPIPIISRLAIEKPVEVPEIWQLKGLGGVGSTVLPPVEVSAMPEPFHILSFGQKQKSERLSEAVIPSQVVGHTGYGQSGIFNPDGATLYTQDWDAELMPATRMTDPRRVSRDLHRQATSSFTTLADDLGHVTDRTGWGRVNAH